MSFMSILQGIRLGMKPWTFQEMLIIQWNCRI